jgi:glycosyltransferase involved in cell wall biosynthesis
LFLDNFIKLGECNFVVFWNNRNIRRKQPGDVILAFKLFVDKLPEEERSKVCLLMHTHPLDPNGTNLFSVYENIAPNCKIHFSSERVNEKILNYYYNLADVTVNIASNEGFGLSNAESIMAGTPVIANVTGGLQDQMGFLDREGNDWIPTDDIPSNHMGEYKDHGEWAFPVYPSNRSLQGSLETPYIFDDRCLPEDVADRLLQVYKLSRDRRKQIGLIGREWLINKAKMTAGQMGRSIINSITTCINNFTEKPIVELIKIENKKKNIIPGISKRI